MRAVLFILKLGLIILAAPVVLALMLFTWLCFGLLYVSSFIFGLASTVVALLGIAVLVTYSVSYTHLDVYKRQERCGGLYHLRDRPRQRL